VVFKGFKKLDRFYKGSVEYQQLTRTTLKTEKLTDASLNLGAGEFPFVFDDDG